MIRIDPRAVIGRIDPNTYGMFIEHPGRCIYGGILDEGSILSEAAEATLAVPGATDKRQRAWVVNGPGVYSANPLQDPESVSAKSAPSPGDGGVYLFPAHSHTMPEAALS